MSIIDFRIRPAIPAFIEHLNWRVARHPQKSSSHLDATFERALPPRELIAVMDDLGIRLGVFTGRDWYGDDPDWPLTNEAIAEAVADFPDRFVGMGGLDPRRPDPSGSVHRAVEDLGLVGICIDGFALGTSPADPNFRVIYEACIELDVPIVITLGALPGIPSPMDASHPRHIDELALRYRDLRIVLSHAGFPFTGELLGVVFRHDNIWMENSFYHFAPGVPAAMVEAANEWVTRRIMFASAYPSAPLAETIERLNAFPFTAEARQRMFHDNAAELLGLSDAVAG